MTPPLILISLPLEGRPQVLLAGCGSGDQERLLAWLVRNPALLEIVAESIAASEGCKACDE